MEKHQGDSFKNSRIKINYKGKKPKITFSYPNTIKDSFWDKVPVWSYLFIGWILIIIFLQLSIDFSEDINGIRLKVLSDEVTNRYYECQTYYSENYLQVMEDTCNLYSLNKSSKYNYNLLTPTVTDRGLSFYGSFVSLGIIFLPPFIVYFIFRRRLNAWYVKWQTDSTKESWYQVIFKPEEINDEGYVEIPLFSNLRLNYEATEEMSKYLELVEVKEHPFRLVRYKKSGKKKTQSYNDELWYARFYFSGKPKSGKLIVQFE